MPLPALKSVVRRWFEGTPRRPIRTRRPHQPLGVERLEDRITPANFVESGGLRFVSNAGFTPQGNEHVASSGVVSIGYVPAKSETFLALVQVDLGKGISAGELAVNTGGASFGPKSDFSTGVTGTADLVAADFQLNGRADLVVVAIDASQVRLMSNNGVGGFGVTGARATGTNPGVQGSTASTDPRAARSIRWARSWARRSPSACPS